MKTYHLVQSLSKEELEEFERQLGALRRKNFNQILQFLKSNGSKQNPPSLVDLQKWILKREKSMPSALQLRNRLSRLNDLLYHFLAQKEFQFSVKNSPSILHQWLTQAFHRRKINATQHDIDGFIHEALDNFMFDEAIHMLRGKAIAGNIDYQIRMADIERWLEQDKKRMLLHLVAADNMRAVTQHRWETLNPEIKTKLGFESAINYNVDLTDLNQEWYVLSYEKSRQSLFNNNLQEKAKLLEEVAFLLNKNKTNHPLFNGVQANVLLNLSYVFMQLKDYQQSKKYLDDYFEIQKKEVKEASPLALVNYLINCIFLQDYETIITLYVTNKEKITESEFFISANYAYCIANIFIGKPDVALSAIPDLSVLEKFQKVLFRNLYVLAFYFRGDLELAKNEIKNLKKSILGFEQSSAIEQGKTITLLIDNYLSETNSIKPTKNTYKNTRQVLSKPAIKKLEEEAFAFPIINWIQRKLSDFANLKKESYA